MPVGTILGLGSGIFSSAYNSNKTQDFNKQNAKLNQHYWNIQNEKLFEQNEQAAQNAMERTYKMYHDLQSPSAMVKQYRQAGLNPALMYSMGGAGGRVVAGPQGGAQGGSGAPTLGLQDFTKMDPLTMAQIANINADTRKKESETDLTEAQIKTEEWITKIKGEEFEITSLRKAVEEGTLQDKIDKIKYERQYLFELYQKEYNANKITEATFDSQIASIISNSFLLEAKICLIEKEQKLTDEQIKETAEKIKLLSAEIKLAESEKALTDEKVKELKNKYEWDNITKEDAFRIAEIGIDALESVLSLIPNKKTLEKILALIAGKKGGAPTKP